MLQITPKIPGPPINATYSNETQFTQVMLITAPPASVLLKGVYISVEATQNPNGTLTATSIIISPPPNQRPDNQPDTHGCLGGEATRPTPAPPGPNQSPSALPDNGSCPAGSLLQKPALPPNAQMNQKTNCRQILGTVDMLQGTTLTIRDIKGTIHTFLLTTGPNATMIVKRAPIAPITLKVGTNVLVVGPAIKGVITAAGISILPIPPTPPMLPARPTQTIA